MSGRDVFSRGSEPTPCPLCGPGDETVLWRDGRCRVILVDEPGYPGFCRVIWQDHVAEMTDLSPGERRHLLGAVLAVESALRKTMAPHKVNLASLGNRVPHLHWHVIPRFRDDPQFPEAVWAPPVRRVSTTRDVPDLRRLCVAIEEEIAAEAETS